MVDISVVIVSYNVKHFLLHCLSSVSESSGQLSVETIVVDNHSSDGTIDALSTYPGVRLIENPENVGFGRATNQGIRLATGKYVLCLNPDTVLSESTLSDCKRRMDEDESIGALGVRMIDGGGAYLRESKRGLPTAFSAFSKLSGLSRLFPRSKFFSSYNLGHLDDKDEQEVPVLCGAFMMLRRDILDEVGLFDEAFFMYGEDIDLSFRISEAGYKNYYLGTSTIIHYKGQSRNGEDIKHAWAFYGAMKIFSKKHSDSVLSPIIHIAIYVGALVSIVSSAFKRLHRLLLDGLLFFGSYLLVFILWPSLFYKIPNYFQTINPWPYLIAYTGIWVFFLMLNGHYDNKRYTVSSFLKTSVVVIVVLLSVYALLPEQYRFSRGVLVVGTTLSLMIGIVTRLLLSRNRKGARIGIVSKAENRNDIRQIIIQNLHEPSIKNYENEIYPNGLSKGNLLHFVRGNLLDELVLDKELVGSDLIMSSLTSLDKEVFVKLYDRSAYSILGSQRSKRKGEVYGDELHFDITDLHNKIKKRVLDFIVGMVSIFLTPFYAVIMKSPLPEVLTKSIALVTGEKTIVGYLPGDERLADLPSLQTGVISCAPQSSDNAHEQNVQYALHYSVWDDFYTIWDYLCRRWKRRLRP